jgi:hypothetical protein
MKGIIMLKGMLAALTLTLLSTVSSAKTITFQQGWNGYIGCEDAYIFDKYMYDNFGDADSLIVLNKSGSTEAISWLVCKFNVTPIPHNATVTGAVLSFYRYAGEGCNTDLEILVSKESWKEDEITFETRPDLDFDNPLDSTDGGTNNSWIDLQVTPAIREFHENPSSNHGFALYPCVNTGEIMFYSSESGEFQYRPKLTVTYAVPDLKPPTVSVVSPNINDTLTMGFIHTIKWIAEDDNEVVRRAIYFSTDNGTNWTLVDSAAGNTGAFDWMIPDVESENCRIKMNVYDATDKSGSDITGVFTVSKTTKITYTLTNSDKSIQFKDTPESWLINLPFAGNYTITIHDVKGKLLKSFYTLSTKQWYTIPKSFSPGITIFKIRTHNKTYVKKFYYVR